MNFYARNRVGVNARQALLNSTAAIVAGLACLGPLGAGAALAADVDQPASNDSTSGPAEQAASGPAEQAADSTSGLADIIVTARRVEENVQRVPIAVNAYSGERLAQIGARDISSLGNFVPGVTMCCSPYNLSFFSFIRGISRGSPTYFADAPVNPEGFGNFFDISGFEVLKGPQGTLFGRTALAGAFVYQPNRPGDKLGGYVALTGGSYDRRTVEGAIDVPLAGDRVLFRLAAVSNYRNGFVHDLSNNKYYGDENYYIVRPSLTVKLGDRLENYTMFQYEHDKNSGRSNSNPVLDDVNPFPLRASAGGLVVAANGGNLANFRTLTDEMILKQRELGRYQILGTSVGCAIQGKGYTPQANDFFNPATSIKPSGIPCPGDWFTFWRLANHTTFKINDDWSIKNIFSYSNSKRFVQQLDLDGTPLPLLDTGSPRNFNPLKGGSGTAGIAPRLITDELQVHGKLGSVDVTAGTFHSWADDNPGIVQGSFLGFASADKTHTTYESHSVFGQADIHLDSLAEGLTATLGGRYNVDKIEQESFAINPLTLNSLGRSVAPTDPAGHATFKNFSYTAGLRYQVAPRTMLYVTNSRGYSAGGFQQTAGLGTYRPQVLTNVEAGVKSTFNLGGAEARINASYFTGWFDDVQVDVWSSFIRPISNAPATGFLISNAAKARVEGVEAEYAIAPFPGLEVGGALAYTNNRYTKWAGINPTNFQPVDLSNTSFLNMPKWKYSFRASYDLPLPSSIGKINIHADYSHRSKMIQTALPVVPTDPTNPNTGLICTRQRTTANGYSAAVADGGTSWLHCIRPHTIVNMGVSWKDFLGRDGLDLSFNVTNLTKEQYGDAQVGLDSTTAFTANIPETPRMWYVTIRNKF